MAKKYTYKLVRNETGWVFRERAYNKTSGNACIRYDLYEA